jgi:hypothetical protein
MVRATGSLLVGVLVVAGIGSEVPARAAAPGRAEERDPETARLIADAVAEYDAGRFEEARALFRAAQARAPTARTARGIGMASFELRDYVEAVRTLGQALRDKRRPLTDEQRRQVEVLLQRAETFVGRFTPHVQPADADLLVDGQPARPEEDGMVLVPFGRHRFTVRCATCAPPEKTVEVNVAGGERTNLELDLTPASVAPAPLPTVPPPPVAASPASALDTAPAPHEEPGHRSSTAVWLAGAAGAGLIGTGVAALWWHNRQGELDTCRAAAGMGDRCTSESTLDTQRNAAIGVTVGLGAAAVGLATAAVVLWTRHGDEQPRPVACLGGIGAVYCAIRF